jgi:hypothetical protein
MTSTYMIFWKRTNYADRKGFMVAKHSERGREK